MSMDVHRYYYDILVYTLYMIYIYIYTVYTCINIYIYTHDNIYIYTHIQRHTYAHRVCSEGELLSFVYLGILGCWQMVAWSQLAWKALVSVIPAFCMLWRIDENQDLKISRWRKLRLEEVKLRDKMKQGETR